MAAESSDCQRESEWVKSLQGILTRLFPSLSVRSSPPISDLRRGNEDNDAIQLPILIKPMKDLMKDMKADVGPPPPPPPSVVPQSSDPPDN